MNSTNAVRAEKVDEPVRVSIHANFAKEHDPQEERKKQREFGLLMGLAIVVLAGGQMLKHNFFGATWLSFAAGLFVIAALGAPQALGPLEKGWMAMAHKMSIVATFIITLGVFFLVIAPIGIVCRMLGKEFLALRFEPKRETYWEPSDAAGSGSRYYLPY